MDDSGHDNTRGRRLSLIGLFINGGLALIKLVAGVVGNSYALVADAVESMADIFGSLVVWSGLRIAQRPPDANHPYGHGRAEPLAAFVVGLMLVGAAIAIGVESISEIIAPQRAPAAFTLWVLLGVVATKEILYQVGRRLAKRSGSSAVLADAWHHRSDAITSLAAAIGISVALIGGDPWKAADGWAALFASCVILFNAWRIMRPPVRELMDAEPSAITERARAIAREVEGICDVEKVFARKLGTRYRVDMHIEVDPAMTVHDAHELAHQVKDAIRAKMPHVEDVLTHIEPHEAPSEPERA